MGLTISVVTPSFNQGQFIERTILSVLNQPVQVEYVVFDGGSSDSTLAILKKYEDRLRWFSEPDHGQAHAVNKGLRATSGEVIGWLNSDDVYYQETLPRVLAYFEAHPEVQLVYGQAHHIDAQDAVLEVYGTEPWDFERLKEICFFCQPAVFFRRSVLEKVGYLNDALQYCMDYEYWLRIGKSGLKVGYLPEFLAGSRLHMDTKTLSKRAAVHAEIMQMFKHLFNRVPDRWVFNYAHAVLESRYPENTRRSFGYLWNLSWLSIFTALRMNMSLTREMLSTSLQWLARAFSAFSRGR